MFAPKDQKAQFRIGSKVMYDYCAGVFGVVRKEWDANGTLHYTIANTTSTFYVRASELTKA